VSQVGWAKRLFVLPTIMWHEWVGDEKMLRTLPGFLFCPPFWGIELVGNEKMLPTLHG